MREPTVPRGSVAAVGSGHQIGYANLAAFPSNPSLIIEPMAWRPWVLDKDALVKIINYIIFAFMVIRGNSSASNNPPQRFQNRQTTLSRQKVHCTLW